VRAIDDANTRPLAINLLAAIHAAAPGIIESSPFCLSSQALWPENGPLGSARASVLKGAELRRVIRLVVAAN
jgi:hypothetical protein